MVAEKLVKMHSTRFTYYILQTRQVVDFTSKCWLLELTTSTYSMQCFTALIPATLTFYEIRSTLHYSFVVLKI